MSTTRIADDRSYLRRIQLATSVSSGQAPDVLPRTFVHLPGVGLPTERLLWRRGVHSWVDLLESADPLARSVRGRPGVAKILDESGEALKEGNVRFFAERLPQGERWRLYRRFRAKALFLDIETTGLSHYYDDITIVGTLNGNGVKTLIAGQDLSEVATLFGDYGFVVTFNGTLFDLRFLREKFKMLPTPAAHLDLRFLLSRLGYRGSLKVIERQLRIRRQTEAKSIDGLAATVLWSRFMRGDVSSLRQLLLYNLADVSALRSLAEFAYREFVRRVVGGIKKIPPAQPRYYSVRVMGQTADSAILRVGGREIVVPNPRPELAVTMTRLLSRLPNPRKVPHVVGIDLTGSAKRPSGWALVAGTEARTKLVDTDDALINETVAAEPALVSIDAPLAFPRGRCCALDSCGCRRVGIARECERILWKRGVRVYPCLLPSMQGLTMRGIKIATRLRELGIAVIESYPGAAQDIMRIPRKGASLTDLRDGLISFGLAGPFVDRVTSHDELDAITSALVGYFYLSGDAEELGSPEEGPLVVPRWERISEPRST